MIHFGLGLAHYLRGENHLAVQALTQAVMIDPRLAVAYELLGNIHLQEGRFQAASTALERAVRLDSSYLLAYYRLAQAYEAQGRILDAWSYYDRSRRILSTRADVQQDVARFVEAYRPIILAREQERVDARRRVSHVRVEPLEVPEDTPMIRVGLLERSAGFTFSAGAPFRLEAVDAESGPLLAAGESRRRPGRAGDPSRRAAWRGFTIRPARCEVDADRPGCHDDPVRSRVGAGVLLEYEGRPAGQGKSRVLAQGGGSHHCQPPRSRVVSPRCRPV